MAIHEFMTHKMAYKEEMRAIQCVVMTEIVSFVVPEVS
jgi:hypothetical protein